jgi:hypothetical protein
LSWPGPACIPFVASKTVCELIGSISGHNLEICLGPVDEREADKDGGDLFARIRVLFKGLEG